MEKLQTFAFSVILHRIFITKDKIKSLVGGLCLNGQSLMFQVRSKNNMLAQNKTILPPNSEEVNA